MPKTTNPGAIWALVIENEYETKVSLHRNEKEGRAALFAYVEEWWGQDIGDDEPLPVDRDEAINEYYERAPGESYTLVESELPQAA